jgi:hypothetical protein
MIFLILVFIECLPKAGSNDTAIMSELPEIGHPIKIYFYVQM